MISLMAVKLGEQAKVEIKIVQDRKVLGMQKVLVMRLEQSSEVMQT